MSIIGSSKTVLVALLSLFLLKGLFLVLLFPFFQQPDEQIHYATIQHWGEPETKDWEVSDNPRKGKSNPSDISTYRLTEETIQVAERAQFDEIRFQKENTPQFSLDRSGPNEAEILSSTWKPFVEFTSSDVSGTKSIYYWMGAHIERALANKDVIIRFFAGRTLSVIIGSGIVLLAYFISRRAGISSFTSLAMASLVAFQPMFASSAAQINLDIALIFSFSLYTLAAVLLLKHGLRWNASILLLISIALGLASKGPGIVLAIVAVPLSMYLAYQKTTLELKEFALRTGFVIVIALLLLSALVPTSYLVTITNLSTESVFPSVADSLLEYAEKAHTVDFFFDTQASYWGNFGWLDTRLPVSIISFITAMEIVGVLGLIFYLFGKEIRPWLLEKKYLWFFIVLILALQVAIRFFDWRIFDATETIILSPMGRYYLPNIIPHLLLVINGLGFFMKNRRQFDQLILWLTAGMMLLSLYSIFFVILPRYYL